MPADMNCAKRQIFEVVTSIAYSLALGSSRDKNAGSSSWYHVTSFHHLCIGQNQGHGHHRLHPKTNPVGHSHRRGVPGKVVVSVDA